MFDYHETEIKQSKKGWNLMKLHKIIVIICSFMFLGCAQFTESIVITKNKDAPKNTTNLQSPPSQKTAPSRSPQKNHPKEKTSIIADIGTSQVDVCDTLLDEKAEDILEAEKILAVSAQNEDDDLSDVESKYTQKKDLIEKSETKPLECSSPKIQVVLDEALVLCDVSQDYWQKGELEKAIEALDQAYSLILTVDTFENPKLNQQIDDLRFTISKRILEIYASRHIVVNGNHNAIPIVINEHVQREIDRFTDGSENRFFLNAYKRSGKYRAMIIEKLQAAGLPEELSWLPLIESGYVANALSPARALGLWQFIPSTGYKFGLQRDTYIDERLDPEKATDAAIEYLKELHKIFGDWTTVLAAYNCGERRVLSVIRDQNLNYLDNFWDLYERLPRETARYVPRFLATLHIVANLEKYGLDSAKVCPPLEYEIVKINKKVHLKDIAGIIGCSLHDLRELNPELRYKIVPNGIYTIRVPLNKSELLMAKLDNIPAASAPKSTSSSSRSYVYHKVRRGETLSTIAERYRTSINRIARANGINKKHLIRAGKTLKIPLGKKSVIRKNHNSKPTYTAKKNLKSGKNHVVQRGDSLWIIARKYGTTTKDIRELNNLKSTRLHIGQVLKIPGIFEESQRLYKVKSGDVPSVIAKQHNMPLKRLLQMNHLTSKSKIYPGQKLVVD